MADVVQIRRDTAAAWTTANPTLANGEQGYETDTANMKVGDGSTAWTSLSYFSTSGAATGRCATYVVAANDSSALVKAQADYVCSGAADQVDINAAIDSNRSILLAPGTFTLSDAIVFLSKNNILFSGSGDATKLVSTNDKAIIRIGYRTATPSTDIAIKNLFMDGTSHAADFSNVITTDGIGIAIENSATERIRVEGCHIYNTGGDGVAGYECGSAIITNNIIRDVRGRYGGIHPHGNDHQFYITNNLIEGCVNSGIRHGRTIADNYVYGCGAVAGDAAIIGSDSAYTIVNNYVYDARHTGIHVWSGLDAGNLLVVGNVVRNAAERGIMIEDAANTHGGTVANNIVYGGCTQAGIYSIRDYVAITGNSVSSVTGAGIQLSDAHNNTVGNNTIYDSSLDGISLWASTHCQIISNLLAGCAKAAHIPNITLLSTSTHNLIALNLMQSSAGHGIVEGAAVDDYNTIINNKLISITGNEIDIQGINSTARGNVGFVTENSGTATLSSADTSIVVNHGLDVTPVAGDIIVVPMETWGNMTKFWIDTYTATQFTIHADIAPGADKVLDRHVHSNAVHDPCRHSTGRRHGFRMEGDCAVIKMSDTSEYGELI
jgi:parallel beta-helix repeat protein